MSPIILQTTRLSPKAGKYIKYCTYVVPEIKKPRHKSRLFL